MHPIWRFYSKITQKVTVKKINMISKAKNNSCIHSPRLSVHASLRHEF